ncbi:core protein 5 [Lymphocystis disease virus 4]|uniref:Core protein 5 n=1 Tax=Lymphocystis disease virus 4 TaxID=2704413 RepID=A0A6B9XJY6_9VIRU|nr:core protein 5 [Lymphocystis disease virus 4]QHR78525.1 core protein 5 [Lymphocystis disease virus 4]
MSTCVQLIKQNLDRYWVEFIAGFSAAFTLIYYFNKIRKSVKNVSIKISKGELICKQTVEKLTGKLFVKTRPGFLLNKVTGRNLELDCYNAELKLAVEYNGEQHYKYKPFFHKTMGDFRELRYRDLLKRIMCKEAGITLITVPYTVKDIEGYLRNNLPVKTLKSNI